jgi:hypothetical protein
VMVKIGEDQVKIGGGILTFATVNIYLISIYLFLQGEDGEDKTMKPQPYVESNTLHTRQRRRRENREVGSDLHLASFWKKCSRGLHLCG